MNRILLAVLLFGPWQLLGQSFRVLGTECGGCSFSMNRVMVKRTGSADWTGSSSMYANATNFSIMSSGWSGNTNKTYSVFVDGHKVFEQYFGWMGVTFDVLVDVFGDNCASNNTAATFTATVANNTAAYVRASWKKNGSEVNTQVLGPGESGTYTFNYNPTTEALNWGYESLVTQPYFVDVGGGQYQYGLTNLFVPNSYDFTNETWGFAGGSNAFFEGDWNPTGKLSGPTNAIDWTTFAPSSTTARDDTLKAGFQSLATYAKEGNQIAREILGEMVRDSNVSSGGSSNYVTVDNSNVVAILSAIYASMTNHSVTNDFHEGRTNVMGILQGGATNLGASALGSTFYGSMSGLSNLASNIAIDSDPDASSIDMSFELMGYTFDLNPLNNPGVANLFSTARNLFKWLLYAGYFIAVLYRVRDVVKTLGTAQQGSLPNAEVSVLGIGGNVGLIAAAVVVPLFLVVIAALMGATGIHVTNLVTGEVGTALVQNPFAGSTGAVLMGVELARHFFPFNVAMGLFAGYAGWYVLTLGAMAIFNAVMRFIFGG